MKKEEDVDILEKLIGQLDGLHAEISVLGKKSPNDAVNPFKLKLINKVLESGNKVLGKDYRPFQEFDQFDPDDVPSNSDVVMILAQYIEQTERFRGNNVIYYDYNWVYILNGKPSSIPAKPKNMDSKR